MHTFAKYEHIHDQIQPGDIFAFGGTSPFSKWTKFTTQSVVTHVAMVLHVDVHQSGRPDPFHQLIEATHYQDRKGVMTNSAIERVTTYDGDVWWLPLQSEARRRLQDNRDRFIKFMFDQKGKKYDIAQLFGSAVDAIDHWPVVGKLSYNEQCDERWFCSELIAEGLEVAGVLDRVNSSEVTPRDICQFSIFDNKYVQLKGEKTPIDGFNSLDPQNWGFLE